jgi:transposase
MVSKRSGFEVFALVYLAVRRGLELVALLFRGGEAKELEIVVLRHQLAMLRRQSARPKLKPADRALLAALSGILPRECWKVFFVEPDTLLRWHRRLVARRWSYGGRPGRPRKPKATRELVLRLARENDTWGYRRIAGELQRLGIEIAPATVWAILKDAGIDPAPRRAELGYVSTHPRQECPRVRFLHGRNRDAAAAVCAVLHRARNTSCPHRWREREPHRRVDRAAGAQPRDDAGRARPRVPVPDPRRR